LLSLLAFLHARNNNEGRAMTNRRELEHLIAGIDEEISDARRDIKEAETIGDDEAARMAEQDIAALQDQR